MNTDTVLLQYGKWLEDQPWDYFATFTTKYSITLKSARRMMGGLSKKVCVRSDSMIFWVAEKFQLRDGYHMHALIRTPIDSRQLWSWWFKRYGRNEIRAFRPDVGATGYVAKYVTKNLTDYDVEIRPASGQGTLQFDISPSKAGPAKSQNARRHSAKTSSKIVLDITHRMC